MFKNENTTSRLERIESVFKVDYTKRHDSAILNLQPGDVQWLVEQNKKYKQALETIAENKDGQIETIQQARTFAEDVLKEKGK